MSTRVSIRRSRVMIAVVGVLAAAAASAFAFAAPASAAPSITVTPSTGLTNGQSVKVTLTFPANTSGINVVQCLTSGTGASDCDVNDAQLGKSVGSNGTTSFTMPVRSTFTGLGASTPIDCTKAQCMIAANVGTSSNPNDSAQKNISFAAAAATTTAAGTTSAPAPTRSAGAAAASGTASSGGAGNAATTPGAVPTGANTGQAITGGGSLMLVAEILGGIAVVLIAASLMLHRRRIRQR